MGGTQTTPNVNQQTIPMFSPDGTLGDVPVAQINQARAAGAKGAVQIKSPGGETGWVPADQLKAATQAGGKLIPIEQQETQHPGFWHSVIEDVNGAVQGAGTVVDAGLGNPGAQMKLAQGLADQVTNAPKEYAERKAAGYSLPYRVTAPVAEAVGVNVPGMEEAAKEGDVAGVAGHTVVPAAAAVAPLAAEGAARLATSEPVASAVRATARGANKTIEKGGPVIGGTAGAIAGGLAGKVLGPEGEFAGVLAGRQIGKEIGKDFISKIKVPGEGFGLPNRVEGGPAVAPPYEPPVPAPEDFREPGTSPQTESAGTSEEQEPPEASTPAPAPKPDTSPAAIQAKLNDALGGKPLQKNVPLKNQVSAKTASSATSNLPEGFTPVDSSAIKGYKYDPQAQELTTISTNGQQYTHAEVSPDEFKAFEDADSKGKAWNTIRQNHVLTQKNGRPTIPSGPRTVVTDPETGAPEFSDVVAARQNGGQTTAATPAKAPAADEDLTNLLKQSLDQVKGKQQTTKTDLGQLAVTPQGKGAVIPPGGVMTSAAPADLAKRWGVDESSIADTDRNVRGLNEQQSQAYINKLADSYKNGRPVEPVMETRDANNNIISVDGRHRAIAAQKAGIERIPIIVRRIGTVQ